MKIIYRDIVSAIIISKDNKLLMGRKDPKGGGVYADCWHIPGGGIDEGEDHIEALHREITEETGIDTSTCKVMLADDQGHGESIKELKGTGEKALCKMKFNIYRVECNMLAKDIIVQPNDDLIKLDWVDIRNLKDYKLTPPSNTLFQRLGYL